MRAAARALGALSLLASASASAVAESALHAVARGCLQRLEQAAAADARPDRHAGCADYRAALAADGSWSGEPLPRSVDALRDQIAWLEDQQRAAPAPRLHTEAVAQALASLQLQQDPAKETLWQRIKRRVWAWLQQDRDEAAGAPGWLRWLGQVPTAVWRGIFFGCLGLLALSLLAVVVLELRAAGVFGARSARPARTPRRRGSGPVAAVPAAADTLDRVLQLDAAQRAVPLLRWVIARLREQRRLPQDDSLTNGELRQRLADDEQRRRFAQLARLADGQLYGGRVPSAQQLAEAAEHAAALQAAGRA